MTALRILHVDTGRGFRGGQAQVELLVRGLAARGHVQALAAPDDALARKVAARGDIAAMRFAPGGDADAAAALGLVRRALGFAPDIVHLHDARAHATGWPAARAARARTVVSRRVAFGAAGRLPHAWKYRRLSIDRFHAISQAVCDELLAVGVAAERIVVVPDMVDAAGLAAAVDAARADGRAAACRAAWGLAAGETALGVIAAWTREKGHDVLLAALADPAAPPAGRVVLLGEGPEGASLAERARHLGVAGRVTWGGPPPDLAAALAGLDGLVVPSRAEGFGSIVLAAHAAGLPVVASAVGGIPEVIEAGVTGTLVPAGDAGALARALADLAADREAARERAARARAGLARFDFAAIAARFEDVYRSIAAT